jgi:hypothetical protein
MVLRDDDVGGQWLHTDEDEDVAASIRHALRSLRFVSDDIQAWKWVALSLHSALQGACVCHLVTTAVPIGAVTKQNAKEWISYFEACRDDEEVRPPRTYLLSLPDLLKEVRKPHSAGDRSNECGIAITDSELAWLRRFHDEIRNQFSHFEPRGWTVEISGLPQLGSVISRIIRDVLLAGWAFRHTDDRWKARLLTDLKTLS